MAKGGRRQSGNKAEEQGGRESSAENRQGGFNDWGKGGKRKAEQGSYSENIAERQGAGLQRGG